MRVAKGFDSLRHAFCLFIRIILFMLHIISFIDNIYVNIWNCFWEDFLNGYNKCRNLS